MSRIFKQLIATYYTIYLAAITAAIGGFYILKSGFYIDPLSSTGITLNTILIVLIIGSLPITLALFNKNLKKIILIEDEALKLDKYRKAGIIRLSIVGTSLVLGVLFFYIMNSQSMIFSAGIAAIALFFCKPSISKIESDLALQEKETETEAE